MLTVRAAALIYSFDFALDLPESKVQAPGFRALMLDMGKNDERMGLLERLTRAAGLSALATATLASGPCGTCEEPYDDCTSIEQFNADRERGLAITSEDGTAGAAGDAGAPTSRPPGCRGTGRQPKPGMA